MHTAQASICWDMAQPRRRTQPGLEPQPPMMSAQLMALPWLRPDQARVGTTSRWGGVALSTSVTDCANHSGMLSMAEAKPLTGEGMSLY